jgi:hypothetical protein
LIASSDARSPEGVRRLRAAGHKWAIEADEYRVAKVFINFTYFS